MTNPTSVQEQIDSHVPKWVWAVIGTLAALVCLLLAGYFAWLGNAVVEQGKSVAQVSTTQDMILQRIGEMGSEPVDLATLKAEVATLKEDAKNRERQLDDLSDKVNELDNLATLLKHVHEDIEELKTRFKLNETEP